MVVESSAKLVSMAKDHPNLDKYLEHFALKTIQAIVQSRNGAKKKVQSKANFSASDWFCVAIEDDESIQTKGKQFIQNRTFLCEFCLCIEIQLQTVDNDKLILETWSLSMKEHKDPSITVTSVYPRMTVLLKSIIAVSRVTPAYKLSSRQSPDSYHILYRFYFGPPEVRLLGEGYQQSKIGDVVTPYGILTMSLAYRTKMTITPQKVEKESPFMVKSDYFKPDMSPKRLQPNLGNGYIPNFSHEDNSNRPFSKMSNGIQTPVINGYREAPSLTNSEKEIWNGDRYRIDSSINPEDFRIAGAFAPSAKFPDPSSFPELILPEKPILNLVSSSRMKSLEEQRRSPVINDNSNANLNRENFSDNEVDFNCNANENGRMSCSGSSECGDFVMVELKPPFARSDSNADLGVFFRECKCAPPLASFASQPSLEEQVSDIATQLVKFEVSLPDFDSFIDEMCKVEASK